MRRTTATAGVSSTIILVIVLILTALFCLWTSML